MAMIKPDFKVALQKGSVGEAIVRQKLEAKGYVVYMPITEGSHAFDMMAIRDKQNAIALDIKAKSRRTKYADTGVNYCHYKLYREFSEKHNMPFWIVFVDESTKTIYGNTIEELDRPVMVGKISYPYDSSTYTDKLIRYWPLCNMKHIGELDDELANELARLSQRNYEYHHKGD